MVEFEVKEDARGTLVICTIDGEVGAARVFSAGLDDAKKRAQEQAEAKVRERAGG